MKAERKRIFISDLPETATQEEIQSEFNKYGKVLSVEIKERKDVGLKNQSLFFSYVNIDIDEYSLQKCFNDFQNSEWHGQYVQLQVARESFLDRLKREREENGLKPSLIVATKVETPKNEPKTTSAVQTNGIKKDKKESSSSESSSSESESEEDVKPKVKLMNKVIKKDKDESDSSSSSSSDSEEEKSTKVPKVEKVQNDLDIIIKNNKGRTILESLKIEGVGKQPIVKMEITKKKQKSLDPHRTEADKKRLQSILEMKKGYSQQKSFVKAALSNVDFKPKNKIIFDDLATDLHSKKSTKSTTVEQESRKSLFDEEEDDSGDDNFKGNFEVKSQFQGKSGQKLLELQSKYKNDQRFALDKRFLEEPESKPISKHDDASDDANEELTLEEEKRKEYAILEEVLGKKVAPREKDGPMSERKVMKRFDPSEPEHSKYELKMDEPSKKKRKRKESETNDSKKRDDPTEEPIVSKDIFYKVTDSLKESLEPNAGFSLLDTFGTVREDEHDDENENATSSQITKSNVVLEKNPFVYDSTDDEDETEKIPDSKEISETNKPRDVNSIKLWSEPLFFKEFDYRFQEGLDFAKRIATQEEGEFSELRRNLKEIVRNKVRHNQRKGNPFKKKLGGNKRKKNKRIQKALNR